MRPLDEWPEIEQAAFVARVFGLDPLTVLDATADEMDIRTAAAIAAVRQTQEV